MVDSCAFVPSYTVAQRIFDEKMSVRETEKLVKEIQNPKNPAPKKQTDQQLQIIYQQLEEKIKSIVGTKVAIKYANKEKGKIEIEYYSQAELERIVELFETIR